MSLPTRMLLLFVVIAMLDVSTGCLLFSDRYWKWRLAGDAHAQFKLVKDSPAVRQLLAEEDASENQIGRFYQAPRTRDEGIRHVKDMLQHPDQYPPPVEQNS